MRRRGFVRFAPPRRDTSHGTTCNDDSEDAALMAAMPSDTEAALDLLRHRASATSTLLRGAPSSASSSSSSSLSTAQTSVAAVAPLVLKIHLGNVLADSAEIESALETMRASNTVRLFRLSASPEVVLCRTSDVRALLDMLSPGKQPRSSEASAPVSEAAVPDCFRKFHVVLDQCRGMSVSTQSLRLALEQQALLSSPRHEKKLSSNSAARSRKRPRKSLNISSDSSSTDDDFKSNVLMLERMGFLRARESAGNSSEVTVSATWNMECTEVRRCSPDE